MDGRNLREMQQVGETTREWLVMATQVPVLSPKTRHTGVPALDAHGLGMVGWSRARDGFAFVRTQPHFGQVLATLRGEGRVLVNGAFVSAAPGSVYLAPPRTDTAYHTIPGVEWVIAWAHVNDNGPAFECAEPALSPGDGHGLHLAIQGLWTEASGLADDELLSEWVRLVSAAARRLIGPSTGPVSRLRPLFRAIEADPAHPWTLPEMAARLAMSGEHLRRLCQKETGHAPMTLVTHVRMRHAESLLASGRYTIAEVAERVGYGNAFAFSTAFKRATGRPPSQVGKG